MIERLYIGGVYVPTLGVNPSITKSLLDITQPDKRKSTYTKTITLPRSKELDKVMNHYYEVNLVTGSFNTNNKAEVRYQIDSTVIINGYLRLNNVNITDRNNITYEVTLSADTARFFSEIKGIEMTELDLSEFDHPFTKELQQLSWDTSILENGVLTAFAYGKGYVYPLIDYGYSTNLTDFIWNQLGCCIYEHEYMKRIIEYAGFTYTSTFLDSAYFKRFIIPASPEVYTLTTAEIADREFAANTPELASTGTTTSGNLPDNTLSAHDTIICTNELSDAGLNYNPVTGIFTCVNEGVYNFMALIDINATFTPSTGAAVKAVCEVDGYLTLRLTPFGDPEVQVQSLPFYITVDEGAGYTTGTRSTSATPSYPDPDYIASKQWTVAPLPVGANVPRAVNPPDRYYIELNGIQLQVGDQMRLTYLAGLYSSFPTLKFVDSVLNYYDGDATITIAVGAFYNKAVNTTIGHGNTLYMSKVIPKVKMLDYFMANVKRFNLVVDIDPADENNLLIEPLDDYRTNEVYNIHELIDNKKPIVQTPMSSLNIKRFILRYKKDGDYWNQQYENTHQRIYGDRIVEVDTDLTTTESVTELIFSPTVLVAPSGSDRVLSTIKQYNESNQPIATKHNIRSLYYGGLLPTMKAWNHIHYIGGWPYIPLVDTFFNYPYAGHLDNPFNPTLDINFGMPLELFYNSNLNAITFTDNNITNVFHAKSLRENTDPRSRFIDSFVHLNSVTYKKFTFDKLYFFNRAYYRLHKIDPYNPMSADTTKCEFLLIEAAGEFTPTAIAVDGAPQGFEPDQTGGAVDMHEVSPTRNDKSSLQQDGNNYTTEKAYVSGEYNYIAADSTDIEIYGDRNQVYSECDNIKIQGDDNVIEAGVKNVTLINTSNVTITESDITYINGILINSLTTSVEEISASQDWNPNVMMYIVDASSGNVSVDLDPATYTFKEGQELVFYRADNTPLNVCRVTTTGCFIDEVTATKGLTAQYKSFMLKYYNGNFYTVSDTSATGGSGLAHGEVMSRVDLGF